MPLFDLDALAAFAGIARHRSFRAAARERNVSASTLSQQMRDLEERLGMRLLNRTTRSVAPTEAGARLLDRLGPAFTEISAAIDQLHESEGAPAGTVRINAPAPAIELVLAPIVGPFLAAYPRVRLEIVAETALVDIVATGFDAGVRWGESLAQDMIAVPLGPPQRFVVVASPELVAAGPPILHPQDLLARPCICLLFPSGVRPSWEFERAGRTVAIRPEGPLVTNNIALQHHAAREGAGFLATFEEYVREDIAAGRLATVLDDWLPSFPGPFLYYPGRRHTPAALRALIDFIKTRPGRGGVAD